MPTVAALLRSTSGLHFSNWFPDVPLKTDPVPGLAHPIPIGHASNGLCGGMVYTVRDYFESRQAPPPDQSAPGPGPLFEYLVDRLIESWDIPAGVLRYLALMQPGLPDFGGILSGLDPSAPSRAQIMIDEEWPKVKSDLDNNHLSPLGLVKVKSTDPAQLWRKPPGPGVRLRPAGHRADPQSLRSQRTRSRQRDAVTQHRQYATVVRPRMHDRKSPVLLLPQPLFLQGPPAKRSPAVASLTHHDGLLCATVAHCRDGASFFFPDRPDLPDVERADPRPPATDDPGHSKTIWARRVDSARQGYPFVREHLDNRAIDENAQSQGLASREAKWARAHVANGVGILAGPGSIDPQLPGDGIVGHPGSFFAVGRTAHVNAKLGRIAQRDLRAQLEAVAAYV